MPPKASYKYFTASDGLYRAFIKACSNTTNAAAEGPTAVQLAGALMGMTDFDEQFLPGEWHEWADANPELAMVLRRSVSHMRTTDGSKFRLFLDKTHLTSTLHLVVSNNKYPGGIVPKDMRTSVKKGSARKAEAATRGKRRSAPAPRRPAKKLKTDTSLNDEAGDSSDAVSDEANDIEPDVCDAGHRSETKVAGHLGFRKQRERIQSRVDATHSPNH
ncbi:hypothetical protein B0I35DRAFT_205626 [Stachybotrys elegans]|uniref:Uncharacterized protein n=1 Tax=Stachybotrys elegans TaxID=80388 RepID=A0A8K0SVQ4_9HYPO|nr:hypothetical protein B0I35DRAFT_205626 [Stachybotrys elegans]